MKRDLDDLVTADLQRKLGLLTGPRQVGKTTLARQLIATAEPAVYLNWDIPADRAVLQRQSWPRASRLVVLDEIHKMPGWKAWLKGVADAGPPGQGVLVNGSARMDTFRQGGESLAGRCLALRLHPVSVRGWCKQVGGSADDALARLLQRGDFPAPCMADDPVQADRWRAQCLTDLVREHMREFSRVPDIGTMPLFVELLRQRVGAPLSLASIARDLAVSPTTVKRWLDILQAQYIVFAVTPWHPNIARAVQQSPKVDFYDTALVQGDDGQRFRHRPRRRAVSADGVKAGRRAPAPRAAALCRTVQRGRAGAAGVRCRPAAGSAAGAAADGGALVGRAGGVMALHAGHPAPSGSIREACPPA